MIKELILEVKKVFGLELLTAKAWVFTVSITAAAGATLEFIDLHIWSPSGAFITFLILLICDFAAAVRWAWRCNKVETKKLPRIIYKMLAYTCLFAIAHNLAKYDPFYFWLPQAVYLPSVAIILLSFIKNLSLLGYIPPTLAKILEQKIDIYKNENKNKD